MKLTPAQIEIERKKFEQYWLNKKSYADKDKETEFLGWLACRESSNEITLSQSYWAENIGDSVLVRDEVIDSLESQGFTVKSQE